ncbi:MAG: M1 family metallopeptidase [Candidatus Sumerlaeia bacterium]|nr:M1 family metallopeptidase [Candidatus Sumerlaeia bacterium]
MSHKTDSRFSPGLRSLMVPLCASVLAVTGLFAEPINPREHPVLLELPRGTNTSEWVFALPEGASSMAVYVEVLESKERPHLFINGARQFGRPLLRGNGLVFPVDNELLRGDGENQLSIKTLEGAPFEIEYAQLFELRGTIEEVHMADVFGSGTSKAAPPLHPSQTQYDVEHYTLDLDVATASRFLDATVTIEARSLVNNLATVALDFSDADFSGQSLTITSVTAASTVALNPTVTVDRTNNWLLLQFPSGERPNTGEAFTITVEYNGEPGAGLGAFGLETYNRDIRTNGKPVVYSFNEPYGARTWFPCKDVTNDKATLDMIITVPDPATAVSNGELISQVAVLGSKTRFHWSHDYPIPPYLIAFSASEYNYFSGTYDGLSGTESMPVGHYIFSESTDDPNAYVATLDVMDTFAQLFGEYPFIQEKYVTMTWGGGFGMEHSTATSTNKNDLRTANGGGYSRRNVHELAHHWFGDSLTPINFDHLWLNEGFATYCEALEREERLGTSSYFSTVQGFISSGINDTTPIVNSNADAFQTSLVYRKGALVLHMLRRVMGDTDFFNGIRSYISSNAYGIVDTQDFEDAMEAQEGTQLDWFFDQWVFGIDKPDYVLGWSQLNPSTLRVTITQPNAPFFRMPVDLQIAYQGGSTEIQVVQNTATPQSFDLPITGTVTGVTLDPNGWIYKGTVTVPSAPPSPILLSVTKSGSGDVALSWNPNTVTAHDGFRLERLIPYGTWTLISDETTLSFATTSTILSGQPSEAVYRLSAVSGGLVSTTSDPYAILKQNTPAAPRILVVDGYDRVQSFSTPNQRFTQLHGEALWGLDFEFDTCANEVLISGAIQLTDYETVVWQCSEESTADIPFNTTEQTLVQTYLQQGGKLFVSGSEIGWAMGRAASAVDNIPFYNNYLRANYVSDDAASYTLNGASGNIFNGLSFATDATGTTIYFADFPDVISAISPADVALNYGTGTVAGIAYTGTFPSGSTPGAVVHLAFPFETILSPADREEVLRRSLTFFGITPPITSVEDHWAFQ